MSLNRRLRLLVIVRSLGAGGAERQLIELLKGIDQTRFEVLVVCFYDGVWRTAAAAIPGVTVRVLEKRGRYDLIGFFRSLRAAARVFAPDIVYGYMFAADIAAWLVHGDARLVWGLRSSEVDFRHYDRFTRFLQWLSRRLAHRADLVISNSAAGLADYRRGGARPRAACVIPNGIDTVRFRPDAVARAAVRAKWSVEEGEVVIGLVARIDPMKGHDVFVRAAHAYLASDDRAVFVCVGESSAQNAAFDARVRGLVSELGIGERVRFVGHSEQTEQAFAGLDIATSASRFGEGFSNSVGEAMACGTPCVVTRVGDSAAIVGDVGIAVAPEDPRALAAAWLAMRADPRRYSPSAVRARIEREYSISRFVAATELALQVSPGDSG
jgi:glycosyltransferase involved in cell wall biosynthesis